MSFDTDEDQSDKETVENQHSAERKTRRRLKRKTLREIAKETK